MSEAITVLLADDQSLLRMGFRLVLEAEDDIEVIGEASDGATAITMVGALHPDVVLMDVRMPGMNGIEATREIVRAYPATRVLILTTFDRDAEILGAIEAGAAGYLLKDIDPEVIIDGIQRAAAGDMVLAPDLASRVLRGMRNPLPRLTAREIDVLKLLATGSTNKEISRALFVTEATVKSHLVHIFTKLGVDSRSRAIHVAQETGLI